MSRSRIACECGCGRTVYPNELTTVVIEEATDRTLRQVKVVKRFAVTRACKEPFEEELNALQCIKLLSLKWRPYPKSVWQRLNFLSTLDLWWLRIGASLKVMRLMHIAFERRKGFAYARRHALRSMILFAAPRFMQGFLAGQFLKSAQRRKAKEDAAHQTEPIDDY